MKLHLLAIICVMAMVLADQDGREFEQYGRITCAGGRTCKGKNCNVRFMVKEGGRDYLDLSNICPILNVWPDGRYHVRCNGKYNPVDEFYLVFTGYCGGHAQPVKERAIYIHHDTAEFVYTGDVELPM